MIAAYQDHQLRAMAKAGDKAAQAELIKRGLAFSPAQMAEAAKGAIRIARQRTSWDW